MKNTNVNPPQKSFDLIFSSQKQLGLLLLVADKKHVDIPISSTSWAAISEIQMEQLLEKFASKVQINSIEENLERSEEKKLNDGKLGYEDQAVF